MKYAHLNLRVPVDFKGRLNDHRVETGVPNTIFVCRLVEDALKQWERTREPKRRRRVAG